MTRKYVVTLEDTLQGWQEDEDELERKYGAEPLDCGNCEIVQASISAGIRTTSRLVDDVLDKIRAEISDFEEEVFNRPNTDYSDYAAVRHCLEIIDKCKEESEVQNDRPMARVERHHH